MAGMFLFKQEVFKDRSCWFALNRNLFQSILDQAIADMTTYTTYNTNLHDNEPTNKGRARNRCPVRESKSDTTKEADGVVVDSTTEPSRNKVDQEQTYMRLASYWASIDKKVLTTIVDNLSRDIVDSENGLSTTQNPVAMATKELEVVGVKRFSRGVSYAPSKGSKSAAALHPAQSNVCYEKESGLGKLISSKRKRKKELIRNSKNFSKIAEINSKTKEFDCKEFENRQLWVSVDKSIVYNMIDHLANVIYPCNGHNTKPHNTIYPSNEHNNKPHNAIYPSNEHNTKQLGIIYPSNEYNTKYPGNSFYCDAIKQDRNDHNRNDGYDSDTSNQPTDLSAKRQPTATNIDDLDLSNSTLKLEVTDEEVIQRHPTAFEFRDGDNLKDNLVYDVIREVGEDEKTRLYNPDEMNLLSKTYTPPRLPSSPPLPNSPLHLQQRSSPSSSPLCLKWKSNILKRIDTQTAPSYAPPQTRELLLSIIT